MTESDLKTKTEAGAETGAFRYGINALVFKLLAAAAMLCDHTAAALDSLLPGNSTYMSLRQIGRFAFPVYCFFIVEGFEHTRSRWKYLRNLCIFAVLSQVPFARALYPGMPVLKKLSVYVTLALGMTGIWVLDSALKSRRRRVIHVLAAILTIGIFAFAAYRLSSDYRYGGVLLIVLFYIFRNQRPLALLTGYLWICYYNPTEMYAFPAFLLLMFYNNQRGKQNKWFFYAFYPAHLAVLAMLRTVLGI